MTTRTTFFFLGVCVGAAVSLISKAARPLSTYALARGMIAYEAVCEAIEGSGDAFSASVKKLRQGTKDPVEEEVY